MSLVQRISSKEPADRVRRGARTSLPFRNSDRRTLSFNIFSKSSIQEEPVAPYHVSESKRGGKLYFIVLIFYRPRLVTYLLTPYSADSNRRSFMLVFFGDYLWFCRFEAHSGGGRGLQRLVHRGRAETRYIYLRQTGSKVFPLLSLLCV